MAYSTGHKSGRKKQVIRVYTNDPQNKTVKLELHLDIQVNLDIAPAGLNFGQLRKGKASSIKTLSLTGLEKDSARIISVASKNKYVQAVIEPSETQGKEPQKINVSILPGMALGRFYERLTIHTDHKDKKVFTVNVSGSIVGDIIVSPAMLSFGIFKQGGEYRRKLNLTAASDVVFKILSAESSNPHLRPHVVTVKEGSNYQLNVKVSDQFDQNTLDEKIILTTDHPEYQKIEIKVFGRSFKQNTIRMENENKKGP